MRAGTVLPLPTLAPRARHHPWERKFARAVLKLGGWQMQGLLPDVPRAVVIVAPHSSNWDGIWVYFAAVAMGIDVRILGKPGLFEVPVFGWILRRYGGVPAQVGSDRDDITTQSVRWLADNPRGWIGIAPEGTRKPVTRWRIGFWKIAHAANVPIVPLYLHYPGKVIGAMPAFTTTGDMRADIAALRAHYLPWRGKHHGEH